MYVLGLSCFYHDSAAALIKDGHILAAAEEERFSRIKHDQGFPLASIKFCLESAGIDLDDVSAVVFYDKPFLKFDRLLETYFNCAPFGLRSFLKAMPLWLKEKIYFKKVLRDNLSKISKKKVPLFFSEHHLSHAASAFYPSPFNEAAILCLDGVGEWATTSAWSGKDGMIRPLFQIDFPHSLGLFYSAFTAYLGFKVNSGEYKMMGLAPYGRPVYKEKIFDHLIHQFEDGSFQLNLDFFDFCSDQHMFNQNFCDLFGHSPRQGEDEITPFHKDLAASVQAVTEDVILKLAQKIKKMTNAPYLCLSGGVALNCVANGKLLRSGLFRDIWAQPASGDSGGALGAAMAYTFIERKCARPTGRDLQKGSLLGPTFKSEHIKLLLDEIGADYIEFNDEDLLDKSIADELIKGSVIGLFQGAMEFGPRALGSRSIIGDARFPKMQSIMNLKIKKRESFRPFAPAVLAPLAHLYFDWEKDRVSPYMLFTTQTKKEDLLATTHVDGSARLQIVDELIHPRFYRLISAFYKKSGCGAIINTSFNVRGEPIVCRPIEAINCFFTTDMDCLVLENFLLKKERQTKGPINHPWVSAYVKD